MTPQQILNKVDHTLLAPAASWEQIRTLCEEALAYHTASVCIPPSYVRRVRQAFPGLTICTVIGFPNGYSTAAVKAEEAAHAVFEGADEVDMVINLGDVKNGDFARVTEEIAMVKRAAGGRILKVIVETCYLTEEEKIALCGCVTQAGADYIKTSTGFGTGGATREDVLLFKKHVGPNVKIKAAGGMKTPEDIEWFAAHADRLGTSRAVKLFKEQMTAL